MLGVGGLGCCRDRGIVGGEMRVERRTKNQGVARASVPDGGERNTLGVTTAPIEHVGVRRWRTATGCPQKLHGRTRAELVTVG